MEQMAQSPSARMTAPRFDYNDAEERRDLAAIYAEEDSDDAEKSNRSSRPPRRQCEYEKIIPLASYLEAEKTRSAKERLLLMPELNDEAIDLLGEMKMSCECDYDYECECECECECEGACSSGNGPSLKPRYNSESQSDYHAGEKSIEKSDHSLMNCEEIVQDVKSKMRWGTFGDDSELRRKMRNYIGRFDGQQSDEHLTTEDVGECTPTSVKRSRQVCDDGFSRNKKKVQIASDNSSQISSTDLAGAERKTAHQPTQAILPCDNQSIGAVVTPEKRKATNNDEQSQRCDDNLETTIPESPTRDMPSGANHQIDAVITPEKRTAPSDDEQLQRCEDNLETTIPEWLAIGRMVSVASRTWAGINRPGGKGYIKKVHTTSTSNNNETAAEDDESQDNVTVDVKYLECELTKFDHQVPIEFVHDAHDFAVEIENGARRSSRDRADGSRRCPRCGMFASSCGDCDKKFLEEEEENEERRHQREAEGSTSGILEACILDREDLYMSDQVRLGKIEWQHERLVSMLMSDESKSRQARWLASIDPECADLRFHWVDWMMKLNMKNCLGSKASYLSMIIFDRIVESFHKNGGKGVGTNKRKLFLMKDAKLLVWTCMFVACTLVERQPIQCSSIKELPKIVDMEREIFYALEFNQFLVRVE